jgi:hypothetical protein
MLNPQIFHSIEFYAAKVESTIRFLNWLMDAVRTIRGLWQDLVAWHSKPQKQKCRRG